MSEVEVPYEGKAAEKATLLLAAAEELGVGQEVIKTRTGMFVAPAEVVEKAFAPREEVSQRKSEDEAEAERPKRRTRKSTSSNKPQE